MSAALSPVQWSLEVEKDIEALIEERAFVSAVVDIGLISSMRLNSGQYVLTSTEDLQTTRTALPPLAVSLNMGRLLQPYPVLRSFLEPLDESTVEEPGAATLNLLVHGQPATLTAEYLTNFKGKVCAVIVGVDDDELPPSDEYKQYRGLFFKNRVKRACRPARLQISSCEWTSAGQALGLTSGELMLWSTDGYSTVCAGGMVEVSTLKAALPSLDANGVQTSKALKVFQEVMNAAFVAEGTKQNTWQSQVYRQLEAGCTSLKVLADSKGVSQPWHPDTIARILEDSLPSGVALHVRAVHDVQLPTLGVPSHTAFSIHPLGPWSPAVIVKFPQVLRHNGLPALMDCPTLLAKV